MCLPSQGAALRAHYAHLLLPYERAYFAPHVRAMLSAPTGPSPKRKRTMRQPAPAPPAPPPPTAAALPLPGQLCKALLNGTHEQTTWALNALLLASSDSHTSLRLDEMPSITMALCFVVARSQGIGPHASGATTARAKLAALLRELPGRQAELEEENDRECVDSQSARCGGGIATAAAAIGPAAEAGVFNDPSGETEHQEVAAGRAAARILRNAAWTTCCEPTGSGAFHLGWHAHLVLTVVCQCIEQEMKAAQACLEQAGGTASAFWADPLLAGRFAMTSDLIDVAHCIATPPWCIHNKLPPSGKETHFAGQWPNVAARIAKVLLSVTPSCTPLWPTRPAAGAALLSRLAAAVPGRELVREQLRASAANPQADRPEQGMMAGVAVALHTQARIFSAQGPLGGDVAPLLANLLQLLRETPPSPTTAAEAAASTHVASEAAACALARLLELQPSIGAAHKAFLLSRCHEVGNAVVCASQMKHASPGTKKGAAAVLAALGNTAAALGGGHGEVDPSSRWSKALCAMVADACPEVAFHACAALSATGARARA